MEATGVVLRQHLRFRGGFRPDSPSCVGPRKRPSVGVKSSGFRDQGHVRYYSSVVASSSSSTAGKKEKTMKAVKKMKKKELKLLKGLFKNLTAFSQTSFGLKSDDAGGDLTSEASELLLKHLVKLKAEEKQLKRKMKEEKARLKMSSCSSSSESSSSEDECGEVVNMNNLKKQVIDEATMLAYPVPVIPTTTAAEPNGLEGGRSSENEAVEEISLKKIEVCMGGKCKKSGAGALLEEFQRTIGKEGAVSGCKCMGKCRDGPNVKVLDGVDGAVADDRASSSNSLCIGVGLEDVGLIVGNFFGGKGDQIGYVCLN